MGHFDFVKDPCVGGLGLKYSHKMGINTLHKSDFAAQIWIIKQANFNTKQNIKEQQEINLAGHQI